MGPRSLRLHVLREYDGTRIVLSDVLFDYCTYYGIIRSERDEGTYHGTVLLLVLVLVLVLVVG
jgi:hypothetical protein